MKANLFNFKLFYKYLLSYVIILLIPLLILNFIIYNFYVRSLKEEIKENNINKLVRIKNNIDIQLKDIHKITNRLYASEKLLPYYINSSQLNKIDIREILTNYDVTNDFIYEIIFYLHGDEMLYSSSSTYKLSTFFDIYNYKNWNEKDFIYTLNNITQPILRPAEEVYLSKSKKSMFISYLLPIPVNNTKPYGTLLYIIKSKTITNIMDNFYDSYDSNTIILDENNNIITAQNFNFNTGRLLNNLKKNSTGYPVQNKNKTYLMASIKSDFNNWKYVSLIPTTKAFKRLNHIKSIFLYGNLFIILLGGLVIYLLMLYNYKPIQKLKTLTRKWSEANIYSNEIEMISSTINKLGNKSETLTNKLISSKFAIKNYLIQSLLKGNIKNIEEFNKKGGDIGVSFNNPDKRVIIISYEKGRNKLNISNKKIIKNLEDKLPSQIEGYGIDSIYINQIIFIIATEDMSDSILLTHLNYLHEYLKEEYKIQFTLGVGQSYQQVSSIGKSYIEASSAIDYKLVHGTDKIILFKNISGISSMDHYPKAELEQFELAILQGNTDRITEVVAKIVSIIKENKLPLHLAKSLSFEIINTVLRTTYEIQDKGYNVNEYPDVTDLTEYSTIEELALEVEKVCFDICNYLHNNKENNDKYLMNQIYEFIENNYYKHNFSVQGMADYFEMSQPNISNYFKEQTGETITEHVTQLRMEKAKRILISENKPIKDIIKKIGYYDPSSFSRKFKQYVGVTPGKYRNLYK